MPARPYARPSLASVLFVLSMAMLPSGARAAGASVSAYDGSIGFGAQLLQLPDGCLSVDGSVSSGAFFADLKRSDVRGELEYRKSGRVVTDYPESLTASIHILGDHCGGALSAAPTAIFRGRSYSLRFVVQWKDGMALSPAILSEGEAHCVGASTLIISSDRNFTAPSVTCQIRIDSKDIPLRDHLIVSVFSTDGTRLTRLSAGP